MGREASPGTVHLTFQPNRESSKQTLLTDYIPLVSLRLSQAFMRTPLPAFHDRQKQARTLCDPLSEQLSGLEISQVVRMLRIPGCTSGTPADEDGHPPTPPSGPEQAKDNVVALSLANPHRKTKC